MFIPLTLTARFGLACAIGGSLLALAFLLRGTLPDVHPIVHFLNDEQNLGKCLYMIVGFGGLLGGPMGLYGLAAYGANWANRFGQFGTLISLIGVLAYIIGQVYDFVAPDHATYAPFAPIGALLAGLGMVMQGIAVLKAQRLVGWQNGLPLLVGLYYFGQLAWQLVFRISNDLPTFSLLLASWFTLWAVLGYVIFTNAANHIKRSSISKPRQHEASPH